MTSLRSLAIFEWKQNGKIHNTEMKIPCQQTVLQACFSKMARSCTEDSRRQRMELWEQGGEAV